MLSLGTDFYQVVSLEDLEQLHYTSSDCYFIAFSYL